MASEEDLMDNVSTQSKDSDIESVRQGWRSPKSKKSKKRNRRKTVVATRASSRITRDGVPIATKTTSDPTNNPFTILNNASTSSLHEVMIDLDLEVDNIEESIRCF
jgi:hypothetical protein